MVEAILDFTIVLGVCEVLDAGEEFVGAEHNCVGQVEEICRGDNPKTALLEKLSVILGSVEDEECEGSKDEESSVRGTGLHRSVIKWLSLT